MSPHRLLYTDLQSTLDPLADQPPGDVGRLIGRGLLLLVGVLLALHVVVVTFIPAQQTAQASPVRSATIHVEPLAPLDPGAELLAQARIEGFRAGLAAAIERSCQAPHLAWPIAAR
jgi:amino acid transporter